MTPQRAQILAETYDRRQIEAELLQRDGQGAFRTAVGFGAALLANMPDPVNLIPFGGAAAVAPALADGPSSQPGKELSPRWRPTLSSCPRRSAVAMM